MTRPDDLTQLKRFLERYNRAAEKGHDAKALQIEMEAVLLAEDIWGDDDLDDIHAVADRLNAL